MNESSHGFSESLFKISDTLKDICVSTDALISQPVLAVETAARTIEKSWSNSWLGYHANVYYTDLKRPPAGARFSHEWGLNKKPYADNATTGDWVEFDPAYVESEIYRIAGNRDLAQVKKVSGKAAKAFSQSKSEVLSILDQCIASSNPADSYLEVLKNSAEKLALLSEPDLIHTITPNIIPESHDSKAISQGMQVPPHIRVLTTMAAVKQPQIMCRNLSDLAIKIALYLSRKDRAGETPEPAGKKAFISHGNSLAWKELRDFLHTRMRLASEEFSAVPTAGIDTGRLSDLLDKASIAFLVITNADQQITGKGIVHTFFAYQAGLAQGKLGSGKTIVVIEEGCDSFSNIPTLRQIRFPKSNIKAVFNEIKQLLEREAIVAPQGEYV